jgi:hypothetical protein
MPAILTDVPPIVPDRVYTLREAAHVSRLCVRVPGDAIRAGQLPVLPAGGRKKLILGADLMRWLRGESTTVEAA